MSDRYIIASTESEPELNGTPRGNRCTPPTQSAEKWDPTQAACGTQYKVIDGQGPAWTGMLSSPVGDSWTLTYDSLLDADPSVPRSTELEPRIAVHVKFVHHNMPELERWYEREHLQMLRAVPGWIRSWRYKLEGNAVVILHAYLIVPWSHL